MSINRYISLTDIVVLVVVGVVVLLPPRRVTAGAPDRPPALECDQHRAERDEQDTGPVGH